MQYARRPSSARLAPALLAGALLAGTSASRALAADARHPVVIELFQSQGCSSCPPANANLAAVADRPEVLALSFSVTYWDQLGWKDTFARPSYTARQWDYARALRHPNVYTPQVVVNGRKDGVGVDPRAFAALVAAADRGASRPDVEIAPDAVRIGAGQGSAEVWLARYDPRVLQVPIRRGENGGKTLPHKNIVRQLVRLGAWTGRPQTLRLPAAQEPGLRTAVFLQAGKGGPILAAAKG
ncbi:DUF1223 domain-containing protein [Phenylobacterium soli]|uniref:DUF1223 domain-containing protein n=1 Tax=Phenylobacterium soli TaxID=2170551 RepID=A0A328AI04_9CAUL|nr:DUF1223 domain-containing protein [Phenylobacterium soli]